MKAAPFILPRAKKPIPIQDKPPAEVEEAIFVPEFEVATTISQLEPGTRESYHLLPFRALKEIYLPISIQQRWEVSGSASRTAEWRLWFKTLNQTQQKAHVQSLCNSTKDKFWAGLLLEYEERSQPQHARFIAAAARAWAILEPEYIRKKMKEAKRSAQDKMFEARATEIYARFGLRQTEPRKMPAAHDEPLSAPLRYHEVDSLKLRLPPCYFRPPASVFRFATQIFSGKSYEEAVAEKEANFNSWVKESKVRRIDGQPDFVVWGNNVVHKDAVPNSKPKKKQRQTGKHRSQKKQSRSG